MSDKAKFDFIYEDPYTGNYVHKCIDTDYWTDALDAFFSFLQGAGYVITNEEVDELFAHRVKEYNNANSAHSE